MQTSHHHALIIIVLEKHLPRTVQANARRNRTGAGDRASDRAAERQSKEKENWRAWQREKEMAEKERQVRGTEGGPRISPSLKGVSLLYGPCLEIYIFL